MAEEIEDTEYTIEDVEARLKNIKKSYSDFTFLLAEKAIKNEMIDKADIAYQKLLKMQYEQINKLYKDMVKITKGSGGDMGNIISYYKKIELGIAKLQQKIN